MFSLVWVSDPWSTLFSRKGLFVESVVLEFGDARSLLKSGRSVGRQAATTPTEISVYDQIPAIAAVS
jgi:hypothetical protein